MKRKIHTREAYEEQLRILSVEGGGNGINMVNVRKMTDFQLLKTIDHELERLGCIRMTVDELERELH